MPIFLSIVACAMEPRMSCCHRRQSNEIDSVNRAASAAGVPENRPPLEMGKGFFMRCYGEESVGNRIESHAGKAGVRHDCMVALVSFCKQSRDPAASFPVFPLRNDLPRSGIL